MLRPDEAGAGLVVGFSLFMPDVVPDRTVLYVSTGVPVFNLYLLGLVVMPQVTGEQRMADTYDFVQSLPVRLVSVNHVLPFESMAVTMRGSLTATPVSGVGQAYLMLLAWTTGCVALALWALGRRG